MGVYELRPDYTTEIRITMLYRLSLYARLLEYSLYGISSNKEVTVDFSYQKEWYIDQKLNPKDLFLTISRIIMSGSVHNTKVYAGRPPS